MKKTFKIGFDMDGVLLSNPIKFIRPITSMMKPIKTLILKQDKASFYFPKSRFEKILFTLLHLSSYRIDPAVVELEKLVKFKKIQIYIISGRYSFLKNGFEYWVNKLNSKKIFTACLYNKQDLQPDQFKQNMIKKLNLDIYVEDNWDIVSSFVKATVDKQKSKVKVFWITNCLDKNIPYKYKFNNLKSALKNITTF